MNNLDRVLSSLESQQMRQSHNDAPPIGEGINAILSGKAWGKGTNLICYFTEVDTSLKFTLSLFRSRSDTSMYCAPDNVVNFSDSEVVGKTYILNIQQSARSKFPSLKKARLAG